AAAVAKHAVMTRSYDNNRTGANTNEQSLTPSALKTRGLRKVFSLKVEGDDPNIEAQPLYVPDVQMSDGTKHDVVYLFSMSNNVRAFDAITGAQLWPRPVSLGKPFVPDPNDPVDIYHINKTFGILREPSLRRRCTRCSMWRPPARIPRRRSRTRHCNITAGSWRSTSTTGRRSAIGWPRQTALAAVSGSRHRARCRRPGQRLCSHV